MNKAIWHIPHTCTQLLVEVSAFIYSLHTRLTCGAVALSLPSRARHACTACSGRIAHGSGRHGTRGQRPASSLRGPSWRAKKEGASLRLRRARIAPRPAAMSSTPEILPFVPRHETLVRRHLRWRPQAVDRRRGRLPQRWHSSRSTRASWRERTPADAAGRHGCPCRRGSSAG